MIRKICTVLPLALLALPAQADWQGKGELGGVLTRGNTDTKSLNARLDMTRDTEKWRHTAGFSVLRSTNDDVTSADRWELRGESDYRLTERSFLFGALRYEEDRFTDFDYKGTAAFGYGYKFIDRESTKLDGRLGVGYRRSELRVSGETQDDAILRGAVDFAHQLTETTQIVDALLIESGSDNTFIQNILGIAVKINDTLALGLNYEVRHNTDVLPGTKKTDQLLTANLVFEF